MLLIKIHNTIKNIIYILVLFLLLFDCSKYGDGDPDPVFSTFLEKYDGTVWKQVDLSGTGSYKFWVGFINNLNNPIELIWESDEFWTEANLFCYDYDLINLNEYEDATITLNSVGTTKDWLDNEISDDTLEFRFVTTNNGNEYLRIETFNVGDELMFYTYFLYENDKMIGTNFAWFKGPSTHDHVDSLPYC